MTERFGKPIGGAPREAVECECFAARLPGPRPGAGRRP